VLSHQSAAGGRGETEVLIFWSRSVAAVLVVLGVMFVQASPAAAAEQFPSGDNLTVSVKWSGEWENVHGLSEITVQMCDDLPNDVDRATARIEVWLENTRGEVRLALAPVVMRIQQFANDCREWADMHLRYPEYVRWVRLVYGGSVSGLTDATRWTKNPHGSF
jgi:hypothetical protein